MFEEVGPGPHYADPRADVLFGDIFETSFRAHAAFLPDAENHRAILISDNCLTSTALAQGRQKRSVGGRLLFAPLSVVREEKWRDLVETEDFERFPLPSDKRLPAWSVAELATCFMVDARDVAKHTIRAIREP